MGPPRKPKRRKIARHLIALLHGWIGIFASLFVFLIAATGVILTFFNEMFELQYGDVVMAEAGPHKPVAEIIEAAERDHPLGLETLGLFMPDTRVEGLETALVYGFEPGSEEIIMVSVDPVTAAYKGDFILHHAFAHELNDFHFSLLMGPWAQIFIAIIGVLMIAFTLTGLYMWWPRGGVRKRDKLLKVQTKGKLVPKMFNWHGLSGVWLGALTLLFAVTGVGLSQPDWLGPAISNVDEPAAWDARFKEDCGDTVTLRQAADQAQAAFPGRAITMVNIASGEENKYLFNLRGPGDWNVRFGDAYAEVHAQCAGEMWTTTLGDQDTPTIFGELMLSLHGGHIFGVFKEVSVVLTGLALMLLSGTGVYVFFKRTLPASRSRRRKRTAGRTETETQPAE
ncbi:MAG: PepSY-associated TM helix domain-containing protein [Pseudomonadota bacterium]